MTPSAYTQLQLEVVRLLEDVRNAMARGTLSDEDGAEANRMVLEVRRFISIDVPRPTAPAVPRCSPGVDIDAVHRNPNWRRS